MYVPIIGTKSMHNRSLSLIWCGVESHMTDYGTPEIQRNKFISPFAILIPFMSVHWHTSCETKRNKANLNQILAGSTTGYSYIYLVCVVGYSQYEKTLQCLLIKFWCSECDAFKSVYWGYLIIFRFEYYRVILYYPSYSIRTQNTYR